MTPQHSLATTQNAAAALFAVGVANPNYLTSRKQEVVTNKRTAAVTAASLFSVGAASPAYSSIREAEFDSSTGFKH